MEYNSYQQQKKNFDDVLMKYISKKIFESIPETDACNEKIIDGVGNIINKPTNKTEWAFTHLDKFILALKHSLGEKYLTNLLKHYEYVKELDYLFLINLDIDKVDIDNLRKHIAMIITKIEGSEYLPNQLEHSEEHIEFETNEMNFCDKASRSLTIASLLLYGIRNDKIPSDIDFKVNVIPSVECTFCIRGYNNYKDCYEYCKENGFFESNKISPEAMRKLVSIADCLVKGNILSEKYKRVENQSNNWRRLANLYK